MGLWRLTSFGFVDILLRSTIHLCIYRFTRSSAKVGSRATLVSPLALNISSNAAKQKAQLAMKLLAPNPKQRYREASQALGDLGAAFRLAVRVKTANTRASPLQAGALSVEMKSGPSCSGHCEQRGRAKAALG